MVKLKEDFKVGDHVRVLRYMNKEGENVKPATAMVMRIHAVGVTDQGNQILIGHRVSKDNAERMWLYDVEAVKVDKLTASRLAFKGDPGMQMIYDAFNGLP